jgi:molybdopterin-guanine dinucleotide biosynthesis protein A
MQTFRPMKTIQKDKITGIVLAGGKSSRMGYDKGLALVGGKKIIEIVIATLKEVCNNIIIISNNTAYADLNLPVHKDIYPDKGPAGGIYTGLFHSSTQGNLVLACDMPFVSAALLSSILKNVGSKQIVVPIINEGIEPLCGFYSKAILEPLKALLEAQVLPAHKVVTLFDHTLIPVEEGIFNKKREFTNINKPEDLENIL